MIVIVHSIRIVLLNGKFIQIVIYLLLSSLNHLHCPRHPKVGRKSKDEIQKIIDDFVPNNLDPDDAKDEDGNYTLDWKSKTEKY